MIASTKEGKSLSDKKRKLILAIVEGIVAAKAQKATEAMLIRTETRGRKREQIQSKQNTAVVVHQVRKSAGIPQTNRKNNIELPTPR